MPNPFEQDVVYDPRRLHETVGELNGSVLHRIITEFEEIAVAPPLPRWTPRKAILITSAEAGYGKSHLIGRLFAALAGRANLIYISPFVDASSAWRSLLGRIMQEMRQPERIGVEFANADEPSQLEQLCHGIITNLTIYLLGQDVIKAQPKDKLIERLKAEPLKTLRENERYLEWIGKQLNVYGELLEKSVRLHASIRSWLKVMFICAYFSDDFVLREACYDWLSGGSIDEEAVREIGLAPRDNPTAELTREESNRISHERFVDFCHLSRWYRPFIFCFDQTENYGTQEALARELAIVIERICTEAPYQLTIITANNKPWRQRIIPFFEDAHKHRLREALSLEGLTRKMATALINKRLAGWPGDLPRQRRMNEEAWMDAIFYRTPQIGIRQFLKLCRVRWDESQPVRPSLDELFNKYFQEIRSKPDRRRFNRDALLWYVREVMGRAGLGGVAMTTRSARYYEITGRTDERKYLFGFEEGTHWRRWKAIIDQARTEHQRDSTTCVVMLRTAEQPTIPQPTWNKINEMLGGDAGRYFVVVQLSTDETIAINAMYDLFNDSISGDVEYIPEEILAFAAARLVKITRHIMEPQPLEKQAPPPADGNQPAAELVEQVREFVERERLTTYDALLKQFTEKYTEVEISNARGCVAEIKVYPTPGSIVLLWRP